MPTSVLSAHGTSARSHRARRPRGLPPPLVMRSSGGVIDAEEAAQHPAHVLVSGPAGGVVGASLVARQAGIDKAIAFDMGGTSTDVCLITDGGAERTSERSVGGSPHPAADDRHPHGRRRRRVHRLAGCGRCASRRARERRRESGPCLLRAGRYAPDGHRREPPAGQAAGHSRRRPPARPTGCRGCAGRARPGRRRSRSSTRRCCARCASSPWSAATIRPSSRSSRTAGRGRCTRASWRRSWGLQTVLVPVAAGVLSALGLVASDERRDAVTAYVCPLEEAGELPAEGEADLRYRGPVVRADGAARPRPCGALPSRARGALRGGRPGARGRAGGGADGGGAPRPADAPGRPASRFA